MTEGLGALWRKTVFVFQEAWMGITRSRWMSGVVVTTMIVALSVLGGFWLLIKDLGTLAHKVGSQVQVVAFLRAQTAPQGLLLEVQGLAGVTKVELISKDEAWRQLRAEMGPRAALDEVLVDNPLPDTLQVTLESPQAAERVVSALRLMSGVEEVKYSQELLERLEEVSRLVRTIAVIVSTILGLATLAIVMNTIRLTVINRRNEIEIMQLVGASTWYIRWPFLLEGILFGLISSLIAIALLVGWRLFTLHKVQTAFTFLPLIGDFSTVWKVAVFLVPIGVILGCFGSFISVHQYLNVTPSREG